MNPDEIRQIHLLQASLDPTGLTEACILSLGLGAVYDDHELQNEGDVMNAAAVALR